MSLILPTFDKRVKPPLGARIDPGHRINRGLVGRWLMNEGAGGKVFDASGNGRTGTMTAATWTGGRLGRCLEFDGSTSIVSCGSNYPASLRSAITLAAWVNLTGGESFPRIITSEGSWSLYTFTSESSLRFYGSAIDTFFPDSPYLLGTGWHHVAATYSGNGITGYMDGVSVGTIAKTGLLDAPAEVTIGDRAAGGRAAAGLIDNVMIFDRALTPSEIQSLYRDPYQGFRRPTIQWWAGAMGGGAGTSHSFTVNDSVGVTDAMGRACHYGRMIDDGIGSTDDMGRAASALRAMLDTLGVSDSLSLDQAKVVSDALGIVDSTIDVWAAARTFSETLGQTDSVSVGQSKVLSDSIGITDVPVKVAVTLRTIQDAVGLSDDLSRIWQVLRTLSDTLGISDLVSEDYSGIEAIVRTITDTVGMTDELVLVRSVLRLLSETMGMTDAVATVMAVNRMISDIEGVTDGVVLDRMISVSDTLGVTDHLMRILHYVRMQDDAVGLLDSMARVIEAMRTVDDSMGISDQMLAQFGDIVKTAWAFILLKKRK